ncbi:uncharacterized protein At4g08330, chloroplastic-like [Selaginella moellendorffii]|uniref:uncharacterized protein At4g08330, chloroplastic-like n=1 Tax=Selaginella moellendorffii TaxID=88036 RepID=UPI000D1C9FB1|nr:uncharacterized protein At4g08330, chloroplastic-like [Selaginella moellendorffii]|eukprot:XP_024518383.1 uncharacterized protein At4g08330, chloroplastic-like [Selaginella moellendorffii]
MEDRVWQPSLSKSQRDVSYSCGACGFALKLSSSDRLVQERGSKYESFSRKKVLVFVDIDDSRFQLEEATTYCWSWSWSIVKNRRRETSKLRCKKCGTHIGCIRESHVEPHKRYCVKITKVLPEQDIAPITTSFRGDFSWTEDHQSSSWTSTGSF